MTSPVVGDGVTTPGVGGVVVGAGVISRDRVGAGVWIPVAVGSGVVTSV